MTKQICRTVHAFIGFLFVALQAPNSYAQLVSKSTTPGKAGGLPIGVNDTTRYWRTSIAAVLMIACPLAQAQMPFQGNPPNEPGAIVKAMVARDLKKLGRYTGWQDIEYTPLFESYPPHNIRRVKGADGKVTEHEDIPTFGTCAQTMLVKSIKVKKVGSSEESVGSF